MTEKSDEKQIYPPYLPFPTFDNFITELKDGMPDVIDKSVLHRKSGSIQSWLPKALQYFKLITSKGAPTDLLEGLVDADEGGRKEIYGDLVREAYSGLFATVSMDKGTQKQLIDWFQNKGLATSTAIRSANFFLDMAKRADVEVSKHFRKTTPKRAPRKPKGNKGNEVENGGDGRGGGGGGDERDYDIPALSEKLIEAMIEKLPEPAEGAFPKKERDRWFRMAELVFDSVYGEVDAE